MWSNIFTLNSNVLLCRILIKLDFQQTIFFGRALNSNNFTGGIPRSLGNLSNLYWLDMADNQLSGSIPISSITAPGLNSLKKAKHL